MSCNCNNGQCLAGCRRSLLANRPSGYFMCKHSVRQVRPAGPFFPLYPASHDGIGNRVALAEHEPDEKKASDSGHDVGTSLHPPAAQELPDVGYMRRLSAEPILSLALKWFW